MLVDNIKSNLIIYNWKAVLQKHHKKSISFSLVIDNIKSNISIYNLKAVLQEHHKKSISFLLLVDNIKSNITSTIKTIRNPYETTIII